YCFFFSSRRRHTRFSRDWSSDVCSSDLDLAAERREGRLDRGLRRGERARGGGVRGRLARGPDGRCHQRLLDPGGATDRTGDVAQIGRASCRERGEDEEGGGVSKKKMRTA